MTEALAVTLPPLKRGDRFVFSYYYQLLGDEVYLAITDEIYTILGDEGFIALTDETLQIMFDNDIPTGDDMDVEVIGELDEQSFADFTNYCLEHNINLAATQRGNVRQVRANGAIAVQFDVDISRIYILQAYHLTRAVGDLGARTYTALFGDTVAITDVTGFVIGETVGIPA